MTYLNRRRKDKPKEIRCKSGRNVVDADAMVVWVGPPGVADPEREKKAGGLILAGRKWDEVPS